MVQGRRGRVQRFSDFLRENVLWLATLALLSFLSGFGQTYVIAVFSGEIRAEYGLSHAGWGAIYAVATTASGVVMLFAGGLADRFRVRHLGALSLLGLAVATLAMWAAEGWWSLLLALFLLRVFGLGMLPHTAITAVGRWFVASRGRAMTLVSGGFSLAEITLPLTFVLLMGVVDWRSIWLGMAVALVVAAPLVYRLLSLERTPASQTAGDSGATGRGGRMWVRAEVLRDPVFWWLVPTVMCPALWNTAFWFHQVHVAEVKGWSHAALVASFPAFTVAAVSASILSGWLVDRFGSARLLGLYQLPMALGYIVFAFAEVPVVGVVALFLLGLQGGAHGMLMSTLWAESYGTRNLGAIRSMLGALMVLGTALGPGLTGFLIDSGIDYVRQGWGVVAYVLVASVLAAFAGRRIRAELPRR